MSKMDNPQDYLYLWYDYTDTSHQVHHEGSEEQWMHPNDAFLWYGIGGILWSLGHAITYIVMYSDMNLNPRNQVCAYDNVEQTTRCFDPSKENQDQEAANKTKHCTYNKTELTYECDDGYYCRFYQSRQKWRCNDARRRAEAEMRRDDGTKVCSYQDDKATTVCYYDDFTCRFWPDKVATTPEAAHYCYTSEHGTYTPEAELPIGYNKVTVKHADDLYLSSDADDYEANDGRSSENKLTGIPLYGMEAAAYVGFATWWPMIMAWIILWFNPSSFMIELYDKACAWSLLGPFAGNWAVIAYHWFKAEELEPAFRPEQLVFPGAWLLVTVGMIWFQLAFWPWVSWWVIVRWQEAVEREDDLKAEANPNHSMEPIYDEDVPLVGPTPPVKPDGPGGDEHQDPFGNNTEDRSEHEGEDPYSPDDPRLEPSEEEQAPQNDWDEDYWDWEFHDNDYDDWSDW